MKRHCVGGCGTKAGVGAERAGQREMRSRGAVPNFVFASLLTSEILSSLSSRKYRDGGEQCVPCRAERNRLWGVERKGREIQRKVGKVTRCRCRVASLSPHFSFLSEFLVHCSSVHMTSHTCSTTQQERGTKIALIPEMPSSEPNEAIYKLYFKRVPRSIRPPSTTSPRHCQLESIFVSVALRTNVSCRFTRNCCDG